jgi:hypothetical protein
MAGVSLDAQDKMAESLINLVDFKITLPLTKKTKNIRTNSFIYLQGFDFLDSYRYIYEMMGSPRAARHIPYRRGFWYVKAVKITYNKTQQTMELTLTPLATVYNSKISENNETSTATTTRQTTSTTPQRTRREAVKLHKVKGCKDQKFLEDIVKKAIGTKTDIEKQAIACYKYYQSNHVYHEYNTSVVDQYNRGFKALWNQKSHSCGPGAATLSYMFKCLGLKPQIILGHNNTHYWVRVKINGKTYYCDQAGAEGTNNLCTNGKRRKMSTRTGHCVVYGGATGGHVVMG